MDLWFILQLGVDIVLFFLVVFLIIKVRFKKSYTLDEVQAMLAKANETLERSEKLAKEVDGKLNEATGVFAVQDALRRKKAEEMRRGDKRFDAENAPRPDREPTVKEIGERKKHISLLMRQGLNREQIAHEMGIPLPEVDLVVSMAARRKEP